MSTFKRAFDSMRHYPSAIAGLIIIGLLVAVSIYAVVSIPYSEAINLWSSQAEWSDTPRLARPAWFNLFRSQKLPGTTVVRTSDFSETVAPLTDTTSKITTVLSFDYEYELFPEEVNVFFTSEFSELKPQVTLTWIYPDGKEVRLFREPIGTDQRFSVSQDGQLSRTKLNGLSAHVGLFSDPFSDEPTVIPGTYQLRIDVMSFEPGTTVDARLVVYGSVHGVAGTDHRRRDLMIALLWGTPIALMFGLFAAVGSTLITFSIAAIGAWYGGWLDALIQRITEVNLQLPVLPILIMVGTFYSRSIWLILGVIIVLNIFSAGIKTYRAMFLQVKNSPFIEAARAYGASDMRIVFRYLIPKIAPVLVPNFVTLIPNFVFLEASLAVLGLGDPILPTWGKILDDAYKGGALYRGDYYWILQPAILLLFTGLAFAMLGFALDRIFNPRLRGV